jgi:hypothetical protein
MRTMRVLSRVTPLLAAGLLGGCGGSGAGGGGGTHVTTLSATLDGYVSGGVAFENSSDGIMLGDTGMPVGRRGFARFEISSIPAGATIVTAVMQMHQAETAGSPYGSLDFVYVEHVDIGLGSSAGLDADDYGTSPLPGGVNFAILAFNELLGLKSVDVTARVVADRAAGRPTSDFRLKFALAFDGDLTNDYVKFQDSELHLAGSAPLLVITYQD